MNEETVSQKTNESWVHRWDLTLPEAAISATITSAVWTLTSGSTVTITAETISEPYVQATLTSGASIGRNCIEILVTYSDGQIGLYTINVNINEPCG